MKRYILISISSLLIILGFTNFTQNNGFEISKQIEIFVTFYKKLNQNYVDEINPAELMNTAITAITDQMDPYTTFWTEQDIIAAKIRSSGQYTGIGAEVLSKDDQLFIAETYKNLPADKSGLKAGDEIIKIDDIQVSTVGAEAEELLKGEAGTKVVITYVRQGKTQITTVNRTKVEIKAVPYYKLLDDNTAYIVLQKFNQNASSETLAALKELKARGADKVILDLRGNPGGLLVEAVNVSNIFIPKNKRILYTESVNDGNNRSYKTKRDPLDSIIPLAVLVNGRSASASEIVSGAVQDLDRGVVIGARSFGKGLVQTIKPLEHNTKLKVTTSRYFIPSGRCIQALDYWHKDENGRPILIKDSDYKAFKTLNTGRTVYDGGGVMPDIEVDATKRSGIADALIDKKAIFDFATNYYYNHKINKVEDFKFTDSDYKDFLDFLKQINFKYETKTEESLEEAMTHAVKEKINTTIISQYNDLLNRIESFKVNSLKNREKEIRELLSKEIVTRYFYREGMYKNNVNNSEEIETAQAVLKDPARYNKILGR